MYIASYLHPFLFFFVIFILQSLYIYIILIFKCTVCKKKYNAS